MTKTDELKQYLSEQTGIPAQLISGNDAYEIIAHAGELVNYVKEARGSESSGDNRSEPENVAPDDGPIEQEAPRPQSTREQFAAWFNSASVPKNIFE